MKSKPTERKRASQARRPAQSAAPEPPHRTAEAEPTESAATLRTIVETARSVMRADTAAVASFARADQTITWRVTSGFHTEPAAHALIRPVTGALAERITTTTELLLFADIGAEFPLHSAEGVRDAALAPLRVRGETLGALIVGFRAAHRFTDAEQQTLAGLAEMAALALDHARLLEVVGAGKRIWEQTFDAIPDGVIVHDAAMQLTRCNASAAEALGFDAPSAAIGMSCTTAFARLFGERAAAYHMSQRAARATSFEIQAEDRRRYLVAVAPLETIEGTAGWSVVTWSDVTELSEVQEQLARTRRLATVGQLTASVAHEINNPLAAVTTCAEATLRDLRAAPDEVRAFAGERNWNFYLEEIVRQALRCKAITRGLLDLARQRRARRAGCDLNAIVERAAMLHAQRAATAGITVETKLDPAITEIATDEAMVRQILDNLFVNALDATAAHGERVRVSTELHGERVRVEVADTGPASRRKR